MSRVADLLRDITIINLAGLALFDLILPPLRLGVGDWLQLENGKQGRVTAIRWRHTEVETRDWDTIIVPNVAADPPAHCICYDFAKDTRDSFAYYAVRYWLYVLIRGEVEIRLRAEHGRILASIRGFFGLDG